MNLNNDEKLKQTQIEAFIAVCDKIARRAQERGLTEEKLKALLDDDFQE